MNATTINDAVTIGGAQTALLANRYRVVRQLGQGGMGSVWLVEDVQLDGKLFAVKMLPSILVSNKRAYNQLKAEALVSMKLTHPNIVTLRAFEENNGNPFLVMDYIRGKPLERCLVDWGVLDEMEVVSLLRPVAEALDYAHAKGVVHRDVKPGNVMVAVDGTPYVLDFGIAREIQETMTHVTGKFSSGTLLYMSPEQLNGDSPKKEQDIYSFAAMAYECLMGHPPFHRGQIEYQIMNKPPEPLDFTGAQSIARGVMAGLAKNPEERPKTCAAVLSDWNFDAEKLRRGTAETAGNVGRAEYAKYGKHAETSSRSSVVATGGLGNGRTRPFGFAALAIAFLCVIVLAAGIWNWMDVRQRPGQTGTRQAAAVKTTMVNVEAPQSPVSNAHGSVGNVNGGKLTPESAPKQPVGTTEAEVTEIAVEAKVQKGRIERIDDSDGFKARKDSLSDLLVQAVAYGQAKRWDKAAAGFTNYVEGCKALIALDVKRKADRGKRDSERREKERKDAEEARNVALAALKRAESAGAKKYAAGTWNDSAEKWKAANASFDGLRFLDAKAKFSAIKGLFDRCFEEAERAKHAETERRAAEEAQRLENQRRLQQLQQQLEERRRRMQSLPGEWTCKTELTCITSGNTSSCTFQHAYSFREDGTYTYESTLYDNRYESQKTVTTINGKWTLSGTTLTLYPEVNRVRIYTGDVHTTKISEKSETYNILWRNDGTFELRYDINSCKSEKSSGISNKRIWYDSAGTYHFEADVKNGRWSSCHVVNKETPRILRRLR